MVRLSVLLSFLLAAGACLAGPLGPYEPATGCYVGAYIELDDNVAADIGNFEQVIGKKHATYFRYVGYGQPFPYNWVKDLHSKDAVPHIAWEPNEGLAAVKDDDYLHGWAQAAARAGGPIFLRYASEMNGNWMAYSGDPDVYVAKWRMVYKIMHEEAPNVIMVWCPYATPKATIPMYYPGDEYVDWVGVNLYSVLHANGDPAAPPSDDPRDLLKYVYDLFAYRKPIAVCEYASTHYCVATKQDCLDFALDNMTKLYQALPTQFPRVRMINWFSVDTGKANLAHNNYSITDNPRKLEAYQKLIAGDYFLSKVPNEVMLAAKPTGVEQGPLGPDPIRPVRPPTVEAPTLTGNVPLAANRPGLSPPNGVNLVVQGGSPGALRGRVEILADVGKQLEADSVMFYLDDRFIAMTNVAPFRFSWDTTNVPSGEHILKVVVSNTGERVVAGSEAAVIIAAAP